MTKRQFSFLLGLVGQAGCVIYDDALRRESSDAASDAPRDAAVIPRDAAAEAARPDAGLPASEASRDVSPEARNAEDVATLEDAKDVNDTNDLTDGGEERDTTVDRTSDGSMPDALFDVRADTAADADAVDSGGRDAPVDTPRDPPIVGCTVDFIVSGVTWGDDGPTGADGGVRVVRLVGDAGSLGAWEPSAGLPMSERAPGAWSTTVTLADALVLEFKFVKMESGRAPEWEEWLPFDSNRSFMVDCAAEGGTVWVDAATDAGPVNRAVGRSYGGAFGRRPLDATK
jgi:hypothetical protein